MPRRNDVDRRVRPELDAPQSEPTEAIAWALLQKPDGWEIGEWLSQIVPDGVWADMDAETLANLFVGAAARARRTEPPE